MIVLGLVQTCFEGSMYLFVFLWVPSMQEAAAPGENLPLGLIFSAFMVSMMLGSLLYKSLVTYSNTGESTLVLHAKLSSFTLLLAAFALAINNLAHDERWRFWAFCLFEACVGIYYPVQGMLRGTMIQNDHRATVSKCQWELNYVLKWLFVSAFVSVPSPSEYLCYRSPHVGRLFSTPPCFYCVQSCACVWQRDDQPCDCEQGDRVGTGEPGPASISTKIPKIFDTLSCRCRVYLVSFLQ
jgi:hypothetical protein